MLLPSALWASEGSDSVRIQEVGELRPIEDQQLEIVKMTLLHVLSELPFQRQYPQQQRYRTK